MYYEYIFSVPNIFIQQFNYTKMYLKKIIILSVVSGVCEFFAKYVLHSNRRSVVCVYMCAFLSTYVCVCV